MPASSPSTRRRVGLPGAMTPSAVSWWPETVSSTPSRLYVVTIGRNDIFALGVLDAASGATRGTQSLGGRFQAVRSQPVLADGRIYVRGFEANVGGGDRRVDTGLGAVVIAPAAPNALGGGDPAVAGGLIYLLGQDGVVYAFGDPTATPSVAAARATD